MKKLIALMLMILLPVLGSSAGAQQYVYPNKGQTADQQQKDEGECHQWAVQQTGYDPSTAQSSTGSGSEGSKNVVGGAARGAAGGYVIGKASGGKTSDATKAGAVIGGLGGAGKNRRAQQQASSSQAGKQDAYQRARSACLEGRGYSVK